MGSSRDDWQLRTASGDVTLEVYPPDLDAAEQAASIRAVERLVYDFRYGDREARRILFQVHARLHGPTSDPRIGASRELDAGSVRMEMIADDLLVAARAGRLVARTRETRRVVVPIEVVPETVLGPGSMPPEAELSWIAIELVGEDGRPIPYQRYSVTLPDGTSREGQLDNTGKATERGIPAGQCGVSFPDLDQATWAPA